MIPDILFFIVVATIPLNVLVMWNDIWNIRSIREDIMEKVWGRNER